MNKTSKCQFCRNEFPTEEMFHGHMAMTMPDPSYEAKIDKWGRKDWWENMKRTDLTEEQTKELEDMAFYDQLLNTFGRSSCCKDCSKEEMELHEKYYPDDAA
jgi:hypothetical protein